ncbi:udp-n-acetylmuramate--l-alanine ligase [Quercus suber]|uniref:Udp-n-acetylmuramate--l-alanine ligase n=1 Tax=Quercus suber TaxID=58331 RepID=A0AAW0M916_QUESU
MDFPVLSQSNSLRFPSDFLEKPKPYFPIRRSNTPLWSTTNHTPPSVPALSKTSSIKCTVKETQNQEPFQSENGRKGWIHFGFEVSGSDVKWSSYMDGLQEAGARLHIGHSVLNLKGSDGSRLPNAIIVSSAIPQDNVEILHAKSAGVPVHKRDYWLGRLTECYKLIAVSGSHGKSTTASMLAYVLKAMGDDITAVIGAHVPQFPEGNIISGGGQNFVLEADEYDGCFLGLSPYIAVVTNLDWEHVDIFEDKEAVKSTFRRFLNLIKVGGHLIIYGDRRQTTGSEYSSGVMPAPNLELFHEHYRITTYGISSLNDWHASSIRPNCHGGSDYTLFHREFPEVDISLQIPGVHNVLNSLAVIATVMALFSDRMQCYELISRVRLHLKSFNGVSRRFEMIGTICGCHIYDDYAHHPTEIRAVLQAARQSRLAALKDEFATALSEADHVVVTAVYAARDKGFWDVSGSDLAASINGPPCEYISSLEAVVDELVLQISKDLHRQIVVLTLGSGKDL